MSDAYHGGHAPRQGGFRDRQDQVRLSRGREPRHDQAFSVSAGAWPGATQAAPRVAPHPQGARPPQPVSAAWNERPARSTPPVGRLSPGYAGAAAPGMGQPGYQPQALPEYQPEYEPEYQDEWTSAWSGAPEYEAATDHYPGAPDPAWQAEYPQRPDARLRAPSLGAHDGAVRPDPSHAPGAEFGHEPPMWHHADAAAFDAAPQFQRGRHPVPGAANQPANSRTSRWLNAAGALMSIALIGGVGLWTYRLMVRDVSGVPVIRALEGPMRTAADTPGGHQAPYRGLSVNEVAAAGAAAPAPDQIVIAPPPVQLRPEDMAIAAPAALSAAPPVAAPVAAPVLIAETTPLSPPDTAPPMAADALTVIPASVPGVSRSPVPLSRPAAFAAIGSPIARIAVAAPAPGGADAQAEAVLQDLVTRLSTPQVTEIDPATLPPGTRLVQFGPYGSADEARRAWDDLARRFPGTLDGRGRIIEEASAGGRLFYRLRAHGFEDEPSARRFCALFEAGGVDCISTLIR